MIDDSEITRRIPLVAEAAAKRTLRCPSPDRLAAYVDARLGATVRSEVEEHLADCTYCLGQIGFLTREARKKEEVAVPVDLVTAARERPSRRFNLVPGPALTALAATALLLTVALSWHPDLGLDPSGARVGGAAQSYLDRPSERTVRNGAVAEAPPRILMPTDGAMVGGLPIEVRWSSSPGVLQYAVQVLSLEGDLVWEVATADDRAMIPSEVGLESGLKYYVWVEARLRNGGSARSIAVAFHVAPE